MNNGKLISAVFGVIFVSSFTGCNHTEDPTKTVDTLPTDISKITREYQCDTDVNPLVGCWTLETCLELFPGLSSDVYANFSYAFRKSGELIHRYREYDTSDCSGEPSKVVDDTVVNQFSEYYEIQTGTKTLTDGVIAEVFKVYMPLNSEEPSPVAYISYVQTSGRLCLGQGVVTGKQVDTAFRYPVDTLTEASSTVDYEHCLIRSDI